MAERRPRLDAVVFDAGGTLVRLDFEWMSEALSDLGFDVAAERLRRCEVDGRRHYDASAFAHDHANGGEPAGTAGAPDGASEPLGRVGDVRAYFGGLLESAGIPAPHIARVVDRWLAHERSTGLWRRPMEGARSTLDAVAAMGLRLAVVSNSDGRAEQHLEHSAVRAGLEFVVDSHRVGVEKPDPAIFRVALDRLLVPPERALYVGDIRCVDARGARAAGMHFVLIDPYGDYAQGEPRIASIAELPDHIVQRFELAPVEPRSRAREEPC